MNEYMEFLRNAIIGWYDNSIYEYHGLDDSEFIEKVCSSTGMTEEFYSDFILNSNNPKFGLMLTEATPSSEIFANMSYQQKDDVYRMVWSDRVVEDAITFMRGNVNPMHREIVSEIAEDVANRYVYNGDYDCSDISYWGNIENLVKEETEKADERTLQFSYDDKNAYYLVSGTSGSVGTAAWLWCISFGFSKDIFEAGRTPEEFVDDFDGITDEQVQFWLERFPNQISNDPVTALKEIIERIKDLGVDVIEIDNSDNPDFITSARREK